MKVDLITAPKLITEGETPPSSETPRSTGTAAPGALCPLTSTSVSGEPVKVALPPCVPWFGHVLVARSQPPRLK